MSGTDPDKPDPASAAAVPATTNICAQCQLPLDSNEQPRKLEDDETLWLHVHCEADFMARRLREEGLANATAAPPSNGAGSNGAAPAAPVAALEPNLADINKHLYAIFNPHFVAGYPNSWIEIATADPTLPPDAKGRKQTGPKSARHFSPFELDKAAAYAVRMNKQGRNIYVGVALRQGDTGPSGRATKDNFLASSRGWGDFDKEGDDARTAAFVKQHDLAISEIVVTGTIPHIRTQVFIELNGEPTWEQVEAVNAAIRDSLGGNGDGVQNCDRIMRLAGTVSYPPPDKVARGYVPELTRLFAAGTPGSIFKSGRAYKPGKLIQLLKASAPGAPVSPFKVPPGGYANLRPDKTTNSGGGGSDKDDKTFWRKVNEMALENLGAWVPEVFGDDAVFQKGTGAYRVSSEKLGRELEEDLSLSPKGITDWGIDDQGKPGEKAGRYTAIDIVIAHGGAADAKQAALWLCEKCGVDPASLDWKKGKGGGGDGAGAGNPEIERLAQLSRVDYEKERKAAAKALGFRVSVLDDLVGQLRKDDEKEDVDKQIADINANHALVLAGNKAAVMKFEEGPTKFRLLQTSAFTAWFENYPWITVGDKAISLGEYWRRHPDRRQYAGIEFAPPGTATRPGHYNLWQGFAVEPKRGDCSKFKAHLKDNAANGDHDTFLWQFGWWAQIFQEPSIKMETALVLRGGFGAGKTKIGEVFGSLLGDHYRIVASPRYITGQFNAHMASLLVLHSDEGFWAGDKKAEGTLKDLVSGKVHMLEYKGIDPISVRNFIRLFVSGNPEWMIPAGFRDRRWAVFDIGEGRMQDNAYFAAINDEMNNGGREALLYELLNFDLKQVNLRVVPKTAALLDQQIESMTHEQSWWFETLMRGTLPSRPQGVNEADTICRRDDLFETYVLHARVQGTSHKSIETRIGMFLKKQLGADLQDIRPRAVPSRPRCYGVPPLADCRRWFSEDLGQPVDWGENWESEPWKQNDDWADALKKAIGANRYF